MECRLTADRALDQASQYRHHHLPGRNWQQRSPRPGKLNVLPISADGSFSDCACGMPNSSRSFLSFSCMRDVFFAAFWRSGVMVARPPEPNRHKVLQHRPACKLLSYPARSQRLAWSTGSSTLTPGRFMFFFSPMAMSFITFYAANVPGTSGV